MVNKIPECHYRISAKALILDENKRFLLVQEENGRWEFPGGGIDHHESVHDALAREIDEEMGLVVTSIADRPSYFLTGLSAGGHWYSNIFYVASVADYDFTPSEECVALKFYTIEEARQLENIYGNVEQFLNMFDPSHH